jgi:hypothetical protein
MATKSWTLLDADSDVYHESFTLHPEALGLPDSSVELETLRGGLREGVRLLQVDNGTLRYAILPDRGMGIWKAWQGDTELGWQSPVPGPVHPHWVPLTEPSGLGWLDGFDELLVRCGLLSNGAPDFDQDGRLIYPLHGRIANLPARHVEVQVDDQAGTVAVTGTVEEVRFHFNKLRLTSTVTTRQGASSLHIHDEVTNFSGNPGEAQLLYHVNFGAPIHGPGAEVIAAVEHVAPRDPHAASDVEHWSSYGPPEVNSAEKVYFFRLLADDDGTTQVLLRSKECDQAVSLKFNTQQLPCFTQWKNTPPNPDGYVTGLEPGTNFPNPRTFEQEQGRVVKLESGQTAAFDLEIEMHPDTGSVDAAIRQIQMLQQKQSPVVHKQPRDSWSA